MKHLLVILFICCRGLSYGQTTKEEVKSLLIGDWDWIKSEIVDRGDGGIITPLNCSCTKKISFNKESVKQYSNDSLLWDFDFYLDEFNFMNDPTKIIIHSSYLTGQLLFWNDTLGIGDFGGCGFIQYFKKNNKAQH